MEVDEERENIHGDGRKTKIRGIKVMEMEPSLTKPSFEYRRFAAGDGAKLSVETKAASPKRQC
jgi:hypothetical protein